LLKLRQLQQPKAAVTALGSLRGRQRVKGNMDVKSWFYLLILALSGPLLPQQARAHQTADSRLELVLRPEAGELDLLAMLPREDLQDLGGLVALQDGGDGVLDPEDLPANHEALTAYLRGVIGASRGGKPCLPTGKAVLRLSPSFSHLLYMETLRCQSRRGPLLFHDAALFERGSYQHLARIQLGEEISSTVFAPSMSRISLPFESKAQGDPSGVQPGASGVAVALWDSITRFFYLGVWHIWGGIDHLLFVFCLLILAGSPRKLLGVITAFTLAHTVTLILSALDVFSLPPQVVEPSIAASILWMAGENAYAQWSGREALVEGWRRILLTFGFGLIHGFGFSYVLRDEVRLPTAALLPALFSFNIGVEFGQLVVVAALWFPIHRLSGTRFFRPAFYLSTSVVGGVALFWLLTRLMS